MANLEQTYASICGIKLRKNPPDIPSNFFPVPEKYIAISILADEEEKKYEHWNIVLDLIALKIQESGFVLLQIGDDKDIKVKHTNDYRNLTFRQNCFVIENAQIVVGNDSYLMRCAGYKKIPIIAAISADHANVTKPHYIGEHIYLESDRRGRKPSYGLKENPRTINLIKPEQIAQAILDILKIDYKIRLETVKVGGDFYLNQLDFVPNYPIEPDIYANKKIIVRLDLEYNIQALAQCLYFYRAAIVTTRPIPAHILQKYRDKIDFIVIILEKGYSKGFIEQISKSGIGYTIISELKGKALTDAKLELMDYNPVLEKKTVDVSEFDANLLFRTNRLWLSNKKFYASAWHYKNGKQYNGSEEYAGAAILSDDFLDSVDSYHFFKII